MRDDCKASKEAANEHQYILDSVRKEKEQIDRYSLGLTSDNSNLLKKNSQLSVENSRLQEVNNQQLKEINKLQEENNQQSKEIDGLNQQLKPQMEISHPSSDKPSKKTQNKKQPDKLSEQNNMLSQQNKLLHDKIIGLTADKQKLENELGSSTQMLKLTKHKLEKTQKDKDALTEDLAEFKDLRLMERKFNIWIKKTSNSKTKANT